MFVSPVSIAPAKCYLAKAGRLPSAGYSPGEPILRLGFTSPYGERVEYSLRYWMTRYGGYNYPANPTGRVRCINIHHPSPTWGKDGETEQTDIGVILYPGENRF